MKLPIILIFTILFGCNEDKNFQEHMKISTELESSVDTDGDGINDLKEKQNGLNPLVANIPNIEVCASGKSIVQYNMITNGEEELMEYKEDKDLDCSPAIYKKAKTYLYSGAQTPINTINTNFSEFEKFNLIKWDSETYALHKNWIETFQENKNFSIRANYKLKLSNLKNIQKIYDIKSEITGNNEITFDYKNILNSKENISGLVTHNKDVVHDKYYREINLTAYGHTMDNLIIKRNPLNVKINDFTYQILNKRLSFKKILSQLEEKTYKLSIYTPNRNETYYVSNTLNIANFLNSLGGEISSNGQLRSLYQFIHNEEGKWYQVGTNSSHLDFDPTVGDHYVLMYINNAEIEDHKNKQDFFSNPITTKNQQKSKITPIKLKNNKINHIELTVVKDVFQPSIKYGPYCLPNTSLVFCFKNIPFGVPGPVQEENIFNFESDSKRIQFLIQNEWVSLNKGLENRILKIYKLFKGNNITKLIVKPLIELKSISMRIIPPKKLDKMINGPYIISKGKIITLTGSSYYNRYLQEEFFFKIF